MLAPGLCRLTAAALLVAAAACSDDDADGTARAGSPSATAAPATAAPTGTAATAPGSAAASGSAAATVPGSTAASSAEAGPATDGVRLAELSPDTVVVDAPDASSLAIAASRALFVSSPAVVVAASSPPELATVAAHAATGMGVPLLLVGAADLPAVAEEIRRLGAQSVVTVGEMPPGFADAVPGDVDVVDRVEDVPPFPRPAPTSGIAALTHRDDPAAVAPSATAAAAGLPVVAVDRGDPRLAADSRDLLRAARATRVVALGAPGTFPAAEVLDGLVDTVLTGYALPGGGQVLFPGRRLVALYGHPGDDNLGVLGEQSVGPAVERARRVAADYDLGGETAIPTFEIITTVASSEAGPDGDYSLESSLDHVRPWVEAAGAAGMYAVLELQPGHTDFLTQAKRYEELLMFPHVGLGLDPEWRLAPGERHMVNIGQVSAAEVNAVSEWLAALVRRRGLPQKLLLLQQFRQDMLPDRSEIVIHPELALVVQMDGFGPQDVKLGTWATITQGGPEGMLFGWKQFYDEDPTVRSPADTIALEPSPVFISFQ